jgi:hypothetical protein
MKLNYVILGKEIYELWTVALPGSEFRNGVGMYVCICNFNFVYFPWFYCYKLYE